MSGGSRRAKISSVRSGPFRAFQKDLNNSPVHQLAGPLHLCARAIHEPAEYELLDNTSFPPKSDGHDCDRTWL